MTDQQRGSTEPIALALRAWAVPERRIERRDRPTRSDHPSWWLVFDTETRLDAAQSLTFGVARLYRPRLPLSSDTGGRECYGEFWFYGEDVTEAEIDELERLASLQPTRDYFAAYWERDREAFVPGRRRARLTEDGIPLVVLPRAQFVRDVFAPMAQRAQALVVGFSLPFDLSRLAMSWSETRRQRRRSVDGKLPARAVPWDAFTGAFSLKLTSGLSEAFIPRIAIKTIDSKRHLMALRGTDDAGVQSEAPRAPRFRGHFLDLRTLAFALTNTGHSLDSACRTFRTAHQKLDHAPTGRVDAEEIEYARGDVLATYDLAEALLAEYARHPVSPDHDARARAAAPLQATKAYSPASVGKAYLGAMGITPPLSRGWAIDPGLLGHAMTAFYGGRAECRIRRSAVPVTYVDFTSMYTTVNGLMRLWEILTAKDLAVVPATADVQELLASITLERAFEAKTWPQLRGFALVRPAGHVLPNRAAYDALGSGWQIGVNPLTSETPLWYALPDLVAATLLTGWAPEVLEAVRLVPSGKLPGLRPVALRGEVPIDPRRTDFFAAVVEERSGVPDRDGAGRPLADFLKVLANAASYGIFAEMIRHRLPGSERMPVQVHGLGRARTVPVGSPEEPGAYAFPPLAALITAAARLMLGLLERSVTDAGGSYVMVDTDSMAIVSDDAGSLVPCPDGDHRSSDGTAAVQALSWATVEAIRRRFDTLNPYDPERVRDILKLEDLNFAPGPTPGRPNAGDLGRRVQLHAFAISSKRYALFNRIGDDVVIRKASEHGLGHLMNPEDPDDRTGRGWIAELWRSLVLDAEDRPSSRLTFGSRPAVSRTTASAPGLLRPFAAYNARRPWTKQVRPFNFLLSGTVAPFGHPPGADPARFHLITRYVRDPSRWLRIRWVEPYSQRSFAVSTGPSAGDTVRLKSVDDVAAEYATHPESKSTGVDGQAAGRRTVGLLGRRPITVGSITYIGKEANELEEVELGLVHELDEVLTDYGTDTTPWVSEVVPALRLIPTAELARQARVSRRTVQRAAVGSARPHPQAAERLAAAAEAHARTQLNATGQAVPRTRRAVLRAFVRAAAK